MKFSKHAVLSGLAMFGAVALAAAAEEGTPKVINNPADFWGTWGQVNADIVADPDVKGGSAERVAITPKPANPWDVGAYANITKSVQKGDVVLLAFWARAEKPPVGNDFIEIWGRVHEAAPPSGDVTPETHFLIGRQWKHFYASGTATKDYPVGSLGCGLQLGTGEQTIEFGPVTIIDYGPGFDVSKLPRSDSGL
jgi:hypothetical protein